MRLAIIGGSIAGTVAVAAVALAASGARLPSEPESASDKLVGSLKLDAAPTVSPVGADTLVTGGTFSYEFSVTNTGSRAVEGLGARSEKVTGGRAGDGLRIQSIGNVSCSGTVRVDCLFPRLGPGEKQTVKVEARGATTRRPGDELVIHTFLGTFAPTPSGGVAYDVIGDRHLTTGRFGRAGASEV